MHDIARDSADFKGRLEQDGAGEMSPLGASFSVFVRKLVNIIRHVLRTSAEVTRRYEQFSEIIQRKAGRSASQFEKKSYWHHQLPSRHHNWQTLKMAHKPVLRQQGRPTAPARKPIRQSCILKIFDKNRPGHCY